MKTWWRVAFVSLLAWTLAVASWANSSWTEEIPLETPPGAEADFRSFVCSAPFKAKAAEPKEAEPTEHRLSREPCEVHGERRLLAVLDILLGVAGLALLAYLGVRSASRKEPAPAEATG